MIEVWHAPRTRSVRLLWALEEMGLDYELMACSFRDPTPEFLAVNPALTIPVLRDGDAVITESIAALQYLGGRYGPTPLVVGPDEPGFAEYLQFLILGEAGLAAPLNALIGTAFMAPEDQKRNFTTGVVVSGFVRRLKLVEERLAPGRDYLAADRFTFADISVTWTLGVALNPLLGIEGKVPELLKAYHARMTDRPAYKRAVAVGAPP